MSLSRYDSDAVSLDFRLIKKNLFAEERQLMDNENPLLVQLNWGKDDREGRFLLKRETDKTKLVSCHKGIQERG